MSKMLMNQPWKQEAEEEGDDDDALMTEAQGPPALNVEFEQGNIDLVKPPSEKYKQRFGLYRKLLEMRKQQTVEAPESFDIPKDPYKFIPGRMDELYKQLDEQISRYIREISGDVAQMRQQYIDKRLLNFSKYPHFSATTIANGSIKELQNAVARIFGSYGTTGNQLLSTEGLYSQSYNYEKFIKYFFNVDQPIPSLLLYHNAGLVPICAALASAGGSFFDTIENDNPWTVFWVANNGGALVEQALKQGCYQNDKNKTLQQIDNFTVVTYDELFNQIIEDLRNTQPQFASNALYVFQDISKLFPNNWTTTFPGGVDLKDEYFDKLIINNQDQLDPFTFIKIIAELSKKPLEQFHNYYKNQSKNVDQWTSKKFETSDGIIQIIVDGVKIPEFTYDQVSNNINKKIESAYKYAIIKQYFRKSRFLDNNFKILGITQAAATKGIWEYFELQSFMQGFDGSPIMGNFNEYLMPVYHVMRAQPDQPDQPVQPDSNVEIEGYPFETPTGEFDLNNAKQFLDKISKGTLSFLQLAQSPRNGVPSAAPELNTRSFYQFKQLLIRYAIDYELNKDINDNIINVPTSSIPNIPMKEAPPLQPQDDPTQFALMPETMLPHQQAAMDLGPQLFLGQALQQTATSTAVVPFGGQPNDMDETQNKSATDTSPPSQRPTPSNEPIPPNADFEKLSGQPTGMNVDVLTHETTTDAPSEVAVLESQPDPNGPPQKKGPGATQQLMIEAPGKEPKQVVEEPTTQMTKVNEWIKRTIRSTDDQSKVQQFFTEYDEDGNITNTDLIKKLTLIKNDPSLHQHIKSNIATYIKKLRPKNVGDKRGRHPS